MPLQLLGAGVGVLVLLVAWAVKASFPRLKLGPNARTLVLFLLMAGTALAALVVYRAWGTEAMVAAMLLGYLGELPRGWPRNPEKPPIDLAGNALSILGLMVALVFPTDAVVHSVGLLIFTAWFVAALQRFLKLSEKWDGKGAMARLRAWGSSALGYAIIVMVAEVAWLEGGMDLWVWFFVFARIFGALGVILLGLFIQVVFEGVSGAEQAK